MKAPKIDQEDLPLLRQALATGPLSQRSAPIRCTLTLEKLSDYQLCIKKNNRYRKIVFPGETKLRLSSTIIKRNAKFIRKFEPNFNKYGAKLNSLQQIKSLKKLNLLIEFSVFMSMNFPFLTGKITLETIKSILKVLFRAEFALDHLNTSLFIFKHISRRAKHKITKLKTLTITSNTMVTFTDNLFKPTLLSQDSELLELLPNLNRFKRLTSLNLHFQDILHKEGFFFKIFENIGTIKTLRALSVRIKLDQVGKKNLDKEDIMRQVDQLESLSLFLDFGQYNKCFGNLFSSLIPLVNIRKLKLTLISQNNCDCSSLAKFITSLKNLTSLKIRSCHLLWKQYKVILKAIRQMEGLRKLSLRQIRQNLPWNLTSEFSYKSVYKAIQNLPLLSSIHLDLSNYALTPIEILAFPGFLQSIPLLEKAKICLRFGADQTSLYNFNLAFYDDIKKLMTKLKKLNIMLIEFPDRLVKRIEKILSPPGRKSRDYVCQEVTINDIRSDFDLLDNNPVLY